MLDVYTLFVCELYVLIFLSIIMFFAWKGAHYDRTLGYLSAALVITIFSVFFSSLRSYGLQFLPIALANMLVMLSYGLLYNAFRAFTGRPAGYFGLIGAGIWGLLCLWPTFYYSLPYRVLVSCLLCIIYTSALLRELWRMRSVLQTTWLPAQLLLWIHLLFHLARIFLDSAIPTRLHGAIGGSNFSIYVILESILFVIGIAFTVLAMVNERTQIEYKRASWLDPLTGVYNRRALYEQAEKMRLDAHRRNEAFSVLLCDLDHFKSINDRFGHDQGDRVLQDFCRLVETKLPVRSCFARLGGEEFAAVINGDEKLAHQVAENIRSSVPESLPDNVYYSVSIGVASSQLANVYTLEELMMTADNALYLAKASGRNRVEYRQPKSAESALRTVAEN